MRRLVRLRPGGRVITDAEMSRPGMPARPKPVTVLAADQGSGLNLAEVEDFTARLRAAGCARTAPMRATVNDAGRPVEISATAVRLGTAGGGGVMSAEDDRAELADIADRLSYLERRVSGLSNGLSAAFEAAGLPDPRDPRSGASRTRRRPAGASALQVLPGGRR